MQLCKLQQISVSCKIYDNMCKKHCSIQEDRNINPCQIEYKFFFFKKEKFNPWHSRSIWVWSHLSVVFPNKNQYNLV